jgi:hypothetical protein
MAIGNRGTNWSRVRKEADADATRRGHPIYIYGDSVRGFWSEYVPRKYDTPTYVAKPKEK